MLQALMGRQEQLAQPVQRDLLVQPAQLEHLELALQDRPAQQGQLVRQGLQVLLALQALLVLLLLVLLVQLVQRVQLVRLDRLVQLAQQDLREQPPLLQLEQPPQVIQGQMRLCKL